MGRRRVRRRATKRGTVTKRDLLRLRTVAGERADAVRTAGRGLHRLKVGIHNLPDGLDSNLPKARVMASEAERSVSDAITQLNWITSWLYSLISRM